MAVRPGEGGVKGDWVEIVIDAGEDARTYEVTARRAGRRVEVVSRRGFVEVSEVTRSGTPVRTARFMSSRILALVEHPAGEPAPHRAGTSAQSDRAAAAFDRDISDDLDADEG
jgi:hypothetical protein